MQLRRFVGLVDLGVLTILIAAVVFPPREMYAAAAMKGNADDRFALALAEAQTISRPDDAWRVEKFAHELGEVGFKDWAVEAGIDGSERTKASPVHWRSLLAASVAHIDRLEAKPALTWGVKAFKACEKVGEPACPSWEKTRMEIYVEHLQAGVEAGIDPRRNPKAFREAGEGRIRATRIGGGHDKDQETPAPTPPPTPDTPKP
jgi:hypothetical protein